MRSLLKVTIAVAGTILGVFMINIMLFCYVPSYRDALERAVGQDDDIPVVTVDNVSGSVVIQNNVAQSADAVMIEDKESDMIPLTSGISYDDSSFTVEKSVDAVDSVEKPQIIDKEYHEDCGTGKGYWVIKYSDGSTSVE